MAGNDGWSDPGRQPIQEREYMREVSVPIAESEAILLGHQVDDKLSEIEDLEASELERRKEFREKRHKFWQECKDIRALIRNGARQEPRKVKEFRSWNNGRVKITDAVTGQVYEDREMTQEERQMGML